MSFLTNRTSSRSWCACAGVESCASRCFYLPGSHIQRNVCQLNKDGNHNHRYQSPEVHIEERLVCVPGISSRARDSETPLPQLRYPYVTTNVKTTARLSCAGAIFSFTIAKMGVAA